MTERDPVRLFEAGDAAPEVSSALRAARAYAPSSENVDAIAKGVALRWPPNGGEGGGQEGGGQEGGGGPGEGAPDGGTGAGEVATTAATKAGAGIAAWKAGAALVGAGAIALGALSLSNSPEGRDAAVPAAPPSAVVATASTMSSAIPVTEQVPTAPSSTVPTATVPIAEGSSSGRPAPAMGPSAASAEAAPPPPEMEILADAQRALASDPAGALRHCAEHAKQYPRGAFSQEREVIAIDALVRLGKKDEARARAERFRAAHPRSAHLRRLDVLVGAPSP